MCVTNILQILQKATTINGFKYCHIPKIVNYTRKIFIEWSCEHV
jgi:hypothetical protein